MLKIFIDSSVLIAALLSPKGGSSQILTFCEGGFLQAVISQDALNEVSEVMERKLPEATPAFQKILKIIRFHTIKKISLSLLLKSNKWIAYKKDAKILAAAKQAKVDYLITLDIRHFIKDTSIGKNSGLAILTPGDFLKILRQIFQREPN